MQTVLIGIDFSPASLNAFRYAANMVDGERARLVLVHAYQPAVLEPYLDFGMQAALLQQQEDVAMRHFKALKASLPDDVRNRLAFEFNLLLGRPAEVLIEQGRALTPDLIVVGAKGGHSALANLLGSTATSLIQRVEHPLLVVPEGATYQGLSRIGYATDYQEDDIRVIDEVLYFAKQHHAKLECVHVRETADEQDAFQQEMLKRTYQYDLIHQHIGFQSVMCEDVVEGLQQYADWEDVDMLVMLTHNRNLIGRLFHRSYSRDLAVQTSVPLWIHPMREAVKVG